MENSADIISRIGQKRFEHSLRVMETAIKLAKNYDIDLEKVKLAAYYHDCGKIREDDKLILECEKYGLKLSKDMEKSHAIIHGFLGAEIAKKNYGIEDEEILDAIRYHTTLRANPTLLEKIVYIADYIEPDRNFEEVNKARELAEFDIDRAILYSLDNTIKFLIDKCEYIAIDTILAWNSIWEEI